MAGLNRVNSSVAQPSLRKATLYGSVLNSAEIQQSKLEQKVSNLISSPKIQEILQNQQSPLKTIKLSKTGVLLLFKNGTSISAGSYDEIMKGKRGDLSDSIDGAWKKAQRRAFRESVQPIQLKGAPVDPNFLKKSDSSVVEVASRVEELFTEASDGFSQFQNTTAAVLNSKNGGDLLHSADSLGSSMSIVGAAGGATILASGVVGTGKGVYRTYQAAKIGDTEGQVVNGVLYTPSLASLAVLGGAVLGTNIHMIQGANLLAAKSASIIPFAGPIMQGFLFAFSGYGLKITHDFAKELDAIMKGEGSEKEKIIEALVMLRQEITLSPSEYDQIKGLENPQEAEMKLLKKKAARLGRRTSDEFVRQLFNSDLDQLILNPNNLEAAKKLLRSAYEANYRSQIRFKRLLFLAVLGIIAFAVTGGLASILFAVGAVIWMQADSSKLDRWIGDKIWHGKRFEVLPTELKTESEIKFIEGPNYKKAKTVFKVKMAALMILSPLYSSPLILFLEGKALYQWFQNRNVLKVTELLQDPIS